MKMRTVDWVKKQRGAISILGAASIGLSLFAFQQTLQLGQAKILDRELDNYARTVASVALRSEMAITSQALVDGTITADQTDIVTNDLLTAVKMYTYTDANQPNAVNLTKNITFGNYNAAGQFVPLATDASNPKGAATPPDFSAVAVQLWSNDSFFGFTPQGRAIYGLPQADINDQGCYCKNRYAACVDIDLTTTDLAALPAAEAALVAVKGSDARKDYCKFGFTDSIVSNSSQTKYPHVKFGDAWVGRPPDVSFSFFSFFSSGSSSSAAMEKIVNHQPLEVVDGTDPFGSSGFFGFGGSSEIFAYEQNNNVFEARDITPISAVGDYRCISFSVATCSISSTTKAKRDVVLSDSVYVGYQGTCVPGSSSLSTSACLSYDDSGTTRYDSCLDIERTSTVTLNFFERMLAFFFGPFLDWERAYEGLDCEVQKMRYSGWMFWGGWQDV